MSKKSKTNSTPDVWLGPILDKAAYDSGSESKGRRSLLTKLKPSAKRRINFRGLIILVAALTAIGLVYFPARWLQDRSLRRSALEQARSLYENGKVDQALTNIDAYLQTWPDDLAGLELKGEVVAKEAYASHQILGGIQALETLLRLDADSLARQEDRKRLIELTVRMGDMIRAGSDRAKSTTDRFEVRYRFANKIAEQRLKIATETSTDDGETHRLLALTLERLSDAGDPKAGADAMAEYQKALRRDPGDFKAAEQLAALRIERRKDQAGADAILDNLIKARPRSIEARLVRARHLLKTGREDRAKADLDSASRLDATNKGVRLMAASLALRRGDAASARRHLGAIPEEGRADSRLDVLLAQIEFLERRPEQALKKLREGLLRSAGTDRELTWRLAYWLIQFGRPEEARPLMAQFRRLSGRQDHPMLRLLEGSLRERAGRHASAIIELEQAREEIDGEWKGELDMIVGRCHEAVGDVEAAQADYIKARDLSPTSPGPRQALARLLLKTEPDRAIAELVEGIRLSPNSPTLQADLAMAYLVRQLALPAERRNWSAAQATVEKGLRAKPDDPSLIRAKARVLAAAGQRDQADSFLEEATKGVARGMDEIWLLRAQSLEERGRIHQALGVLEEASKPGAAGDKAPIRIARASLLAKSGHGRAALELPGRRCPEVHDPRSGSPGPRKGQSAPDPGRSERGQARLPGVGRARPRGRGPRPQARRNGQARRHARGDGRRRRLDQQGGRRRRADLARDPGHGHPPAQRRPGGRQLEARRGRYAQPEAPGCRAEAPRHVAHPRLDL